MFQTKLTVVLYIFYQATTTAPHFLSSCRNNPTTKHHSLQGDTLARDRVLTPFRAPPPAITTYPPHTSIIITEKLFSLTSYLM